MPCLKPHGNHLFDTYYIKNTIKNAKEPASNMPRVVWAEEPKSGLGFEIEPQQQKC